MMKPTRGVTLVEVIVSVTILALLMGIVAWFGKGATDHRVSSEKKLKRLTDLQRVMFTIENDLLSARRHTLGNVLCNNIIFQWNGQNYRTSSDPGFDLDYPNLTNDPDNRGAWYFPSPSMGPFLPGLPSGYSVAEITRMPTERFRGMGSLAVTSSREDGSLSVRSPDIRELRAGQGYVLCGMARGDNAGGFPATASIALQDSLGNVIAVTGGNATSNWVNLSVTIPASDLDPLKTYNVLLRMGNTGSPPRALTCLFDNISLTPDTTIADIRFEAAQSFSPSDVNVNVNNRNDVGMVFYTSNLQTGDLEEMKYVFGNGDQRTFPARKPILLRYTTSVPFLDPIQPVWPGDTQKISLPNMARLTVSWVGDASLGTNRPLQMTLTVRDLVNAQQTVSLSRTIFPLTD